jgi:hypothetical protein
MKTIHKFPVAPETSINLPATAKVLTVAMQNGAAQMWVELDTEAPKVMRRFVAFGTGHEINIPTKAFIGTIFVDGLVFHVYEV